MDLLSKWNIDPTKICWIGFKCQNMSGCCPEQLSTLHSHYISMHECQSPTCGTIHVTHTMEVQGKHQGLRQPALRKQGDNFLEEAKKACLKTAEECIRGWLLSGQNPGVHWGLQGRTFRVHEQQQVSINNRALSGFPTLPKTLESILDLLLRETTNMSRAGATLKLGENIFLVTADKEEKPVTFVIGSFNKVEINT